jgi:hypothetical protein
MSEASSLESMIAEAREMQEKGKYINGRIFHALVAEIERLRALVEELARGRGYSPEEIIEMLEVRNGRRTTET